MLAIDWLVHQCHGSERLPFARPVAVNLIEGSAHDVVTLLDELAYGSTSTPGLEAARDEWREAAKEARWLRKPRGLGGRRQVVAP